MLSSLLYVAVQYILVGSLEMVRRVGLKLRGTYLLSVHNIVQPPKSKYHNGREVNSYVRTQYLKILKVHHFSRTHFYLEPNTATSGTDDGELWPDLPS